MKKFTAVLAALLILFTATLFAACDQKDNGASDRVSEEEWEKAFDLENVTLRYLNTATDEESGEVQMTTDCIYKFCETDGANVCYGKGSTTMPSMPEPNRNENEFYIQEKDGKIYNYAKDGSGNWTVTENAAISVSYLKSVIGLVREFMRI